MQLFCNGTVLSMRRRGGEIADAVLVDQGVIVSVGSREALQASARHAQQIDLEGHALLPAFVDAHSHFSAVAGGLLQIPLEDCTSFDALIAQIQSFCAKTQPVPGTWLIGKGYDHNQLTEQRHPTRTVLDQAAPYHPLIIQHKSGHMGVCNSAALEKLGITADTVSPAGGRIGMENGMPTGYLEEAAFLTYQEKIPLPKLSDLLQAYQKAQEIYASYGITTLQEGMMTAQLLPLYQALLAQNLLQLDLVGYAAPDAYDDFARAAAPSVGQYDRHFKLGGLKIFLDGSPQGRTAWMMTPYQGSTDCGYGTMSDAALQQALTKAVDGRLQILAHCNGDAAAAQFLDALDGFAASNRPLAPLRPVMIHAQLLQKAQLPAVKRLGVIPSFFVSHVYHWGDTHIQNFGPTRAAQISPAHSAEALGIPFTFHQDSPVLPPDPLDAVWCAVNRMTKHGVCLGPAEKIDVYSALSAITCNAAYAYFEETRKGSIAPGKQADFVVLDQNPLTVDPAQLRTLRVLETIRAGKTVYRRA